MKDTYIFPAVFDFAEDGISIEFPDLPGCLPCADTVEEAVKNALAVLREGGLVLEELHSLPWSSCCATVIDRYGVCWWISI